MIADKRIFFLFLVTLLSVTCFAQKTKWQLQKEKQQNITKIKETEKILGETTKKKKNSIGELNALNERIGQQEVLMLSIQSEIELLDYDIDENNQIIAILANDIEKLKKEYGQMIFDAQKANGKINKLTFLFSAQSFNQLVMRLKYMEQYRIARKEQAKAITKVQQILLAQIQLIQTKRQQKQSLLNDKEHESIQLTNFKKKKKEVVKSLEKEEKELKKGLTETKKAIAELDELIAKIIKEEMERAAAEAKRLRELKAKANKKEEEMRMQANANAAIVLSASFEENKSKLPWPSNGFISQQFGRQKHTVLKGIEIQSDGIKIQTKQDEPVRNIFGGEVKKIALIGGLGTVIIINHGDFFTVYAGLKDVVVKLGQKITSFSEIGKVITTSEGISELRFQIFKNTTPLDPQQWLRKN